MNWIEALSSLKNQSQSYVLLTVLETKGSSPRDTGSKMVVTAEELFDTIGGGALEHQAIKLARKLLAPSPEGEGWGEGEEFDSKVSFSSPRSVSPHPNPLPKERGLKTQYTQIFNLGKDLKQCCGGVVKVFFEVFPASHFNIVIFGAGHIGKALVKILEDVDCQVTWFDSRPEQFPKMCASHINIQTMTQPELAVESCKTNSYFLVMTHDHALDQTLCEAILSRRDSAFCGLIGSATKGLKFRQRLLKKGFNKQELEMLNCPSGLSHLKSKIPMEIAISMVAELLFLRDQSKNIEKQDVLPVVNLIKNIRS